MKRPGRSRFVALAPTRGPICPGLRVLQKYPSHTLFLLLQQSKGPVIILRSAFNRLYRDLPVTKLIVKKLISKGFGEPPGWRKPCSLTPHHLTTGRTPFLEEATRPEGSELTFRQMKKPDSG